MLDLQLVNRLRRAGLMLASGLLAVSCAQPEHQTQRDSDEGNALPLDVNKVIQLPSLGGTQLTVSGLSSGAFMAVQLSSAHSATIRGVAAFAGGAYACAEKRSSIFPLAVSLLWSRISDCMKNPDRVDPEDSVRSLRTHAEAGLVDPLSNFKKLKVSLYQGDKDAVVNPQMVDKLELFYNYLGADVRKTVFKGMGHSLPSSKGEVDCEESESPFLSRCSQRDGSLTSGAGEALQALYGKLNPPGTMNEKSLFRFNQKPFISADAQMDAEAYVYIPQACRRHGSGCRVHIALHGCGQSTDYIDDTFPRNAGYNEWAETNQIVVVYPMIAKPSLMLSANPQGCWDWYGYTGKNFATREAPQIRSIMKIWEAIR